MEINEKIPPPIYFNVKYDQEHFWQGDHFFGCSLTAAIEEFSKFDYLLAEFRLNNAIFVNLIKFPELTPKNASIAYEEGYKSIKNRKELFKYNHDVEILHELNNDEKIVFINNLFKKYKNSYLINIGKFGEIIKLIHDKKCKKVLFAGKIEKPKISNLKLDFKGFYYLPRIIKASKLGDAAILKEIIKILAQNNIKTENSLKFNPELSLKKGNYSKFKPNKQDQLDIKKAIKTLNSLREYNFSQGVVVRNNKVVSIEGKGGTKKMLEKNRSKKFRNHGVLVKFPKKKQDLRVDLPTIGLKTLKQSKTAGLKGIVIKSKQQVFLDENKCIKFANKNKMFISVK